MYHAGRRQEEMAEDGLLDPPRIAVRREYSWFQRLVGWHRVKDQLDGPYEVYTGRILSELEWAPLKQRWADVLTAVDGEGRIELDEHGEPVVDDQKVLTLIRDTLRAMGIPPDVVMGLPGAQMWEAVQDFLASQYEAGIPPKERRPRKKRKVRSPLQRRATASPSGTKGRTTPSR